MAALRTVCGSYGQSLLLLAVALFDFSRICNQLLTAANEVLHDPVIFSKDVFTICVLRSKLPHSKFSTEQTLIGDHQSVFLRAHAFAQQLFYSILQSTFVHQFTSIFSHSKNFHTFCSHRTLFTQQSTYTILPSINYVVRFLRQDSSKPKLLSNLGPHNEASTILRRKDSIQ